MPFNFSSAAKPFAGVGVGSPLGAVTVSDFSHAGPGRIADLAVGAGAGAKTIR
jgi:hypothetical protein